MLVLLVSSSAEWKKNLPEEGLYVIYVAHVERRKAQWRQAQHKNVDGWLCGAERELRNELIQFCTTASTIWQQNKFCCNALRNIGDDGYDIKRVSSRLWAQISQVIATMYETHIFISMRYTQNYNIHVVIVCIPCVFVTQKGMADVTIVDIDKASLTSTLCCFFLLQWGRGYIFLLQVTLMYMLGFRAEMQCANDASTKQNVIKMLVCTIEIGLEWWHAVETLGCLVDLLNYKLCMIFSFSVEYFLRSDDSTLPEGKQWG